MYNIATLTRNMYLATTLAKLGFFNERVTHCRYLREVPYFVLYFLPFLFCLLCGVIFKSVLKSIYIFSIISDAGF